MKEILCVLSPLIKMCMTKIFKSSPSKLTHQAYYHPLSLTHLTIRKLAPDKTTPVFVIRKTYHVR